MSYRTAGRVIAAIAVATSLQACAGLANARVAMLPTENASSQRSMLSLYNPLPFQHRSASQGWLLRAPEERNSKYIYLGY
jgi:hypothetical protein